GCRIAVHAHQASHTDQGESETPPKRDNGSALLAAFARIVPRVFAREAPVLVGEIMKFRERAAMAAPPRQRRRRIARPNPRQTREDRPQVGGHLSNITFVHRAPATRVETGA